MAGLCNMSAFRLSVYDNIFSIRADTLTHMWWSLVAYLSIQQWEVKNVIYKQRSTKSILQSTWSIIASYPNLL